MTEVVIAGPTVSMARRIESHVSIMRLDHSIKNIFVLPGILLPILSSPIDPTLLSLHVAVGIVSVTLIACSNYVINEVLDAPFDRFHPTKCNRPAALGTVHIPTAYVQWVAMMALGLLMASRVSMLFLLTAAALWVMGCIYNIPPLRAKDVPYVDVLVESVNNPLRMLLGWFMVTSSINPPITLLIAYWMIGAYFMSLKRFSEYRQIGDSKIAGAYRKSFVSYSEESLLVSVLSYASMAMLFLGAFIVRYRIELILSFPAVGALMAVYFKLAFQHDSPVQNPDTIYRQKPLMVLLAVATVLSVVLLTVRIPAMSESFAPTPEVLTCIIREGLANGALVGSRLPKMLLAA